MSTTKKARLPRVSPLDLDEVIYLASSLRDEAENYTSLSLSSGQQGYFERALLRNSVRFLEITRMKTDRISEILGDSSDAQDWADELQELARRFDAAVQEVIGEVDAFLNGHGSRRGVNTALRTMDTEAGDMIWAARDFSEWLVEEGLPALHRSTEPTQDNPEDEPDDMSPADAKDFVSFTVPKGGMTSIHIPGCGDFVVMVEGTADGESYRVKLARCSK